MGLHTFIGHYPYQLFQVVSIAFCSSFVWLLASCVFYSFDVVCCSFKNKPDKMVSNQTKSKRL